MLTFYLSLTHNWGGLTYFLNYYNAQEPLGSHVLGQMKQLVVELGTSALSTYKGFKVGTTLFTGDILKHPKGPSFLHRQLGLRGEG